MAQKPFYSCDRLTANLDGRLVVDVTLASNWVEGYEGGGGSSVANVETD